MIEISFLEAHPPSSSVPILAGVIALDDAREVGVAFRKTWTNLVDPEIAEVLEGYGELLGEMLGSMGGKAFLAYIDEHLSNTVRVVSRVRVPSDKPVAALTADISRLLL